MPVAASSYSTNREDEINSVVNALTSLPSYDRILNVDMPAAKAKLVLSQLRLETRRALSALAKTHALLAEMELLVVKKQFAALKSKPQLADANHSSRPSVRKLSVRPKNITKSETKKPTSDSSQSSLHKLDKKSKGIAKTASNNTACATRVCNLAKSFNSLQIKKKPNERPKSPTVVGVQKKISDSDKAVPLTSTNMKRNSKITPFKSEVEAVNDKDIPDNKNETSDTLPNVNYNLLSKKIYGIANYNIKPQEKVAHPKNFGTENPLQASSKDTEPKANFNRMKPHRTSLKVSFPLNIADKLISIKPKKCITIQHTRRDIAQPGKKEKKQSTKDTPPLKISRAKPASKEVQKRSKLSVKNTKEDTLCNVTLPSLSNSTNKGNAYKKSPMLDLYKKEKQNQYRNIIERADGAKESVIVNIKEKQHVKKSQPIRANLSTIRKNHDKLQKHEISATERKTPPVEVRVSLPLTTSNLAAFNRALQTTGSKNVDKTQMETQEQRSNKSDEKATEAQSLIGFIPSYSYTIPNLPTNPATKDKQNLDKPECGNDEIKESHNNQDKSPLFAWRTINWDTWKQHKTCNEESSRVKEVERREYKIWPDGTMRKVSWEMYLRRLHMNVPSTEYPCPDPPVKKACLEQKTNEVETKTSVVADNRANEKLSNLSVPTNPAETESRESTLQSVTQEMPDNHEAANQVTIMKENADELDDTRSIHSDQTALICTMCECLHETNVCPNQRCFKFLDTDYS